MTGGRALIMLSISVEGREMTDLEMTSNPHIYKGAPIMSQIKHEMQGRPEIKTDKP